MNLLEIFETGAEVAGEIETVAVELGADEAITTPAIDVTLEGHKYALTLNLSPVKS